MKKTLAVLIAALLAVSVVGCAATPASEADSGDQSAASSTQSEGDKAGSATLAQLRSAAEAAGYTVTDDYIDFGMEGVVGGFSVEIVAEEDIISSIMECETLELAQQNADTINQAGYNIALLNGKIITCYGVDDGDTNGTKILKSILEGNPLPVAAASGN